jgi:putative ABC transport system permease protein
MFKNYFKIAWRNLLKDKLHSFINIVGLSLGMSVAVLIAIWVYNEFSYDKNFKHHKNIAQVIQHLTNNGEMQTWKSVPYPLAEELRTNYGRDFKHVVMAVNWGDHQLTIDQKKLKVRGGFFEKEMPEMFTLDMLRGNRSALNDQSAILLSASTAKAYFGDADPMNKVITIDQMPPLKVAGVYEDMPMNSSLANLNFIAGMEFWYHANNDLRDTDDPWRGNFTSLFVELNDNADIASVNARIKDAKLKKLNADLRKKKPELFLHPMSQWHLYGEFKNGKNVGGGIQYVRMFEIIGVFVLLLACINFMNLSTARSEKRAKEVGVRKTIGSLRGQLILQFFSESLLTVAFAFVLSMLLAALAMPFFNQLADRQMAIPWTNVYFWAVSIVFILLTAFVAGSYPAFYLSSFRPVQVLKGTFKAGRFAAVPRKAMVVVQFTVSVALIIGTVIVYQQVQHARDRNIGYNRANLITIPSNNVNIHQHFDAVKAELQRSGAITEMAESESPTTGIWNTTSGFSWNGKDPNLPVDLCVVTASYDFGKTIGWQIKEGRGFSRDFPTDSSGIILNEASVRFMGLKNPVGEPVVWWGQKMQVIGVIKNMIIESPYDEVRPMIYTLSTGPGNMSVLKLAPDKSTEAALNSVSAVFKKFDPDQPFEYSFVDDEYARKFGNEERVGKIASVFGVLAIIISCLGLFGLTSFVAEQRKKEIGVRKVLGASVFNLWNLLSREFVLLVVISFFIAVPISWYFMHGWLQNYTYRTSIPWWLFLATGLGTIAITLITVSFQSIRAAMANPVKSLRTE